MTPVDYETYTFLNDPDVFRLYAYVRGLSPESIKEALCQRQLSSLGDDKFLRVKLLHSLVLSRCPNARIPWSTTTPEEIDGSEAARTWLQAEAVHDVSWMRRQVNRKTTLKRETQPGTLLVEDIKTTAEPTVSEKSTIETRLHYLTCLKQWGLNFTGETGQPARNFLENLKDYRRFSRIDDSLLFDMLPCILDDKTRSWYRAKNFTSWDVFEPSFLNALVLLRDDDYPASPRLVSVAVGDSDLSSLDSSRCDSVDRNPDNPRPYRSSSYCLQALKRKSVSIKREIDDDDVSSVSSVSTASSIWDPPKTSPKNYVRAYRDYNYAQPNNYGNDYVDYTYLNGYANSGHPVNVHPASLSELSASMADRYVHEVVRSSQLYGFYPARLS